MDDSNFPEKLELDNNLPGGKPYIYTCDGYIHESLLTMHAEWNMEQEVMQALQDIGAQIVFHEVWKLGEKEVRRSAHVLSLAQIPFNLSIGADESPPVIPET